MIGHIAYLDGGCGSCRWTARWLKRWERERRLQVSFYDVDETYANYGLTSAQVDRAMHVVRVRDGRVFRGFRAVQEICRITPALWVLVPLVVVLGSSGLGDRLYSRFAARRRRAGVVCRIS